MVNVDELAKQYCDNCNKPYSDCLECPVYLAMNSSIKKHEGEPNH